MIPGQYDDSRTVLDTSYFQVCFQELNFRNVISGTIFQKQCFKNIISGTVFQEHIFQEQYFRNNISGTVFQEQYFKLASGFLGYVLGCWILGWGEGFPARDIWFLGMMLPATGPMARA